MAHMLCIAQASYSSMCLPPSQQGNQTSFDEQYVLSSFPPFLLTPQCSQKRLTARRSTIRFHQTSSSRFPIYKSLSPFIGFFTLDPEGKGEGGLNFNNITYSNLHTIHFKLFYKNFDNMKFP